jgi:hypothetical protein
MSSFVEDLKSHVWGYAPQMIIDLFARAANGDADAIKRLQTEIVNPAHWDSITVADVPMLTALEIDRQGTPRELADDAEREAVAAIKAEAGEMLMTRERWLLPLLHHAGATIVVGPGVFAYFLPAQPTWYYMPRIGDALGPPEHRPAIPPLPSMLPTMLDCPEGELPMPVVSYLHEGPDGSWSPEIADPERRSKHLRLQRVICGLLLETGLLPLMQDAPAPIIAFPGHVFYSLPAVAFPWIEIPGMGKAVEAHLNAH